MSDRAETISRPETLRQSLIARFDACPRSALLALQSPEVQPSLLAARGTLFHAWVGRVLREMRAQGSRRFPTDLGLSMLLDVLAQRDVPESEVVHLPMREMRWLRVLVTKWCEGIEFDARRIVTIEERLSAELQIPGASGTYGRVITGKPDVLVADPPNGMIVVDWKTGWASPPRSRRRRPQQDEAPSEPGTVPLDVDDTEGTEDRLSDQGFVQQVVYGLLVLSAFPTVERVTLREYYVLWGEYREATIKRWQMERIMDVLIASVARLDAAVDAGPRSRRWIPTAGPHCAVCPSPRRCPIREWVGAPANEKEARSLAQEWIVAGRVRSERLPYLKGWVEHYGPIEIEDGKGRREVGWVPNSTGSGRRFVMYEPIDDSDDLFDQRLERAARERRILVEETTLST